MDAVKAIADLIKAVAWPAVALTAIFLFRNHIGSMTGALGARIAEANKIKLKIGSVALELAREIARTPAPPRKKIAGPSDTIEAFNELAKRYDDLSTEDEADRVAERQKISEELARLATALPIPRPTLSDRSDEGAMVALATLTINSWTEDDIDLLRKISSKALFNFTRYRIVLGLLTSIARSPSDSGVRTKAEAILRNVEAAATVSPSLQRLIDKTRTVVKTFDEAFSTQG